MDNVIDMKEAVENEELVEAMDGTPKTLEGLEVKAKEQLIDLRNTMEINIASANTVKGWDNTMRALLSYGIKGVPDQAMVHEMHLDTIKALEDGCDIVSGVIEDTAYLYDDTDEDIFASILNYDYTSGGPKDFEENMRQVLRWQLVAPYAERLQALRSLTQDTMKDIVENDKSE